MAEQFSDFMAAFEAERLAALEKDIAEYDAPEAVAAREAKRKTEFDKGVRLGWWDAEGNSLIAETEEDEDETEEDEE